MVEPVNPAALDDRRHVCVIAFAAATVVAIPFVVMVVLQRGGRWYPILDQAMIELLVRDVGTEDSPTTGLVGRFVVEGQRGDHPGPLSWYLLWPFYRLFGSTSWALIVASVAAHLIAAMTMLWMVARRHRPGLVLAVAVAVVVVARGYGIIVLSEVWNPHLPVLWWLVYVLATWAVVCGDRALVVVMAFAGSLCVQTHVSYFGPAAALLALAVVVMTIAAIRDPAARRRELGWVAAGGAVTAVLWLPPVFDQLFHDRANLGLLSRYFTDGDRSTIGWREGADVLLVHLNPWRLVTGDFWGDRQSDISAVPSGSLVPGFLVVGCWLATAIVAARRRDRPLVLLHVVTGVTLISALVAASRIIPPVWWWVVLWMWGVAMMVLVAIGATLVTASWCTVDRVDWWRLRTITLRVLAAGLIAATVVFTVESVRGPRVADHPASLGLGRLVRPTVAALRGPLPGTSPTSTYLVTWDEPARFGSQGFGLINELERHGFDVGTTARFVAEVRPHRVIDDDATARLALVGGVFIDRLRAQSDAVELAYDDPRTPAERAEYGHVRAELIARLEAAGRHDLVPLVDENYAGLLFTDGLDVAIIRLVERLSELGVATAVFLVPVGKPPPAD